jgi:hypothetical protein
MSCGKIDGNPKWKIKLIVARKFGEEKEVAESYNARAIKGRNGAKTILPFYNFNLQ